MRILHKVVVKILNVFQEKAELFLIDCFEEIFIIAGKKKELSTFTTLTLD